MPRASSVGQPLGRPARRLDQVERRAVAEEAPEVAQRLGVQAHQRVPGLLSEHGGHRRCVERAQLRVAPRPVLAERGRDVR